MWLKKPTYIQVKTWLETVVRPLYYNADISKLSFNEIIDNDYLANYEQLLRYRPDWEDTLLSSESYVISLIVEELEDLCRGHELIELDISLCQP
mgnify:CR=1 FL=1